MEGLRVALHSLPFEILSVLHPAEKEACRERQPEAAEDGSAAPGPSMCPTLTPPTVTGLSPRVRLVWAQGVPAPGLQPRAPRGAPPLAMGIRCGDLRSTQVNGQGAQGARSLHRAPGSRRSSKQGAPGPHRSLTAGTSGPPAHTRARRSPSEATGSEAAFAPASLWWPPPVCVDRRGCQRLGAD